jgi:hypothetical protein
MILTENNAVFPGPTALPKGNIYIFSNRRAAVDLREPAFRQKKWSIRRMLAFVLWWSAILWTIVIWACVHYL